MINVELLSLPDDIEGLMSFAALGCYQGGKPQSGEMIDLKKRIFDVGHHTVLQHINATFWVEGLAVSDFTFGLHLCHPFYNTSQRSGRFCATMFSSPDLGQIEGYIDHYWPNIRGRDFGMVMNFIKDGLKVYNENIARATELARESIKQERPNASAKYIEANASKFAQEQLRVFVPTIFPTAATITINLSTLVAMAKTAWTPTLKDVTKKMANLILAKHPKLSFMFEAVDGGMGRDFWEWAPEFLGADSGAVIERPTAKLRRLNYSCASIFPKDLEIHPTDLLNFHPLLMDNRYTRVEVDVEMSVATMGQDHRHRTIERTKPVITGRFYLPPLAKACGLEEKAKEYIVRYMKIRRALNMRGQKTLATAIVPYGATVSYTKIFNLNAAIHEMLKRGCWCAQEEIYHLAVSLRSEIEKKYTGYQAAYLLKIFLPICLQTGKCGEGARYCGRKIDEKPDFPDRKI